MARRVPLKRFFLALALACSVVAALPASASAGDIADAPCFDAAGPDTATCPAGTEGIPYSITIKLKEGSGCGDAFPPQWTVSSGSLPPGLTLSSNGMAGAPIAGTPTQAGNFTFYVTVRHPYDPAKCAGDFSDKKLTIPINPGLPKLTIGPESTAPGTRGALYSLQMTASVSDPKTWSINSGQLPPGLAIDANTGLIAGTPTTSGTFTFEVLARMNGDSRQDTKVLGIVIREPVAVTAADPFSSARRAVGEVGVPFEAMLVASGGDGTYTWSLASGALPPGLELAQGAVAGTPQTAGVFNFVVRVADAEGRVGAYPARVVIAPKLVIVTRVVKPGRIAKFFQRKLITAGGIKPALWRLVRGPLPRGVFFDRGVGVFYGYPARAGVFRVTVEATDALGVKTLRTLRLVILGTLKPKR